MEETPRISESEWEIMKVLWHADKPVSANEIIDAVSVQVDWSPKTVRTLITRLVQKKAVGIDQSGRTYAYYPIIAEEEGMKTETHSFLKRIGSYALKPVLVQFLSERRLSEKDIEELKSLLDERKE
ncbi:MAG: BlaI/MecI/CopY family transcriptional regulator [Candidatus Pristimantibacillus sp.]